MTAMTMTTDMTAGGSEVAKAMAKRDQAQLAYNVAAQAVAEAEQALAALREARYAAHRNFAAAEADLTKAQQVAAGDDATSGIDWSRAKSSYSGAAGKCCCGCAGNHSDNRVAIKRQINKIKFLAGQGVTLDIQDSYVAAEQNGRLYIVYFN